MKLLTKYGRASAAWLLLIFFAGSVAYYFAVRFVLLEQVDETLSTEREETELHIRLYNSLPTIPSTSDQQIVVREVGSQLPAVFRNALAKDDDSDEMEPVRQLSYTVSLAGKWYQYTVSIPLEHTEALLKSVVLVTVVMIAVLLLALYFINSRLAKRLMGPFYRTVSVLKDFSPANSPLPALTGSDIDEFATLNESIRIMSQRVQEDYQTMQSFTAHAAHELQTPVAVMQSQLDALTQTLKLDEAEAKHMESLQRALHNLSRLQSSLLLLAKVEARQYAQQEAVELKEVVEAKCAEYSDLFELAGLRVFVNLEPLMVEGNAMLCAVLVGNLLSNAARYNRDGGTIHVQIAARQLSISNSSYLPLLDTQQLFSPFYRHEDTGRSGNGLGLPIVKQICDAAGWRLSYAYEGHQHRFTVLFQKD